MKAEDYFDDWDTGKADKPPFFTEALPCHVCGDPCDELVESTYPGVLIGKDCSCSIGPVDPPCPELEDIFAEPGSIQQLLQLTREHQKNCVACQVWFSSGTKRKPVQSERRTPDEARRVA